MLRLKANKTSLYKLVSEYEEIPSKRLAEFCKAYREPDYWLEWMDAGGLRCTAFFSVCLGKPLLSIEKREFGGVRVSRQVHTLTVRDLLARGMIEEFRTAAAREKTSRGAV